MRIFLWALLTVALAYPVAMLIQHGFDPKLWPAMSIRPWDWFSDFSIHPDPRTIVGVYWDILTAQSQVFSNGGWSFGPMVAFTPLFITVVLYFMPKPPQPKRDVAGTFGDARFATEAERSAMAQGLELGIDPETGHAVRVAVQGTLATMAPPRKGKTSGLLIPNLAYPEPSAWGGPAVVLDSKGEVYRATHARRSRLGRRVVCLDPLGLAGGKDTWNPLIGRDPTDILYLQQTALALLPDASGGVDDASAYFRNRAVDLIVGAMLAVLNVDRHSIANVQETLTDETLFRSHLEAAGRVPAALAALEIINADSKTKDPIKSTALQAFQWLGDQRMRHLVSASTFDFSELSRNEIDIFIAVPPEYKIIIAPLLRWFLSDLFTAIRRNRPQERVVIFIDEAAALGRFDELLTASTELPGYGASTWTLWQDRSQIISLYGEAGASTLINTAEVVTISDLSAVDPTESDRWSRALGNYTGLIESFSHPSSGQGAASTSTTPQAAPLMSREALVTMPAKELLVFANSAGHARHPMRLNKTVAHTDRRIKPFIESVAPVGRAS